MSQSHSKNKKALTISFFLILSFMIVEIIGGLLTNSLALLSDAGHMLSDAASLGLSLFAMKFGEKASDLKRTYGYRRFEILAALINGVTLIAISVYILLVAYDRFMDPPGVASAGMLTVAIIGLAVNLLVAWILMKGDTSENLNLRSAFLHVLGDMLGSVGAIIAALMIMFFGWNTADPLASVIVAILVLISGWRVTKDSIHVLMEGKPDQIEIEKVKKSLLSLPHVKNVHDLHIWSITSDFPALSCHIVVQKGCDRDKVLKEASNLLTGDFSISHTTVQLEGEDLQLTEEEKNCN